MVAESVSEETRERITEAAVVAVRAAPVSTLAVAPVAERAGVATSSIYKAYGSKYELFAEASRRVLLAQVAEVAESLDEDAAPLERLRAVLAGMFRVGRDEPFATAYLYGMFPLLHHGEVDPGVREMIDHVDAEVRARLRHRVADAVGAGELTGDPDELADVCALAAFGYLGAAVHGEPQVSPDAFAAFVVRGLRGA